MVVGQPRSSHRFEAKPCSDEAPLVKGMLNLARAKPRYGYRRIGRLLREEVSMLGCLECFVCCSEKDRKHLLRTGKGVIFSQVPMYVVGAGPRNRMTCGVGTSFSTGRRAASS